jgi:biofilm PGA synthesis N-glycosyltransferase PgaC
MANLGLLILALLLLLQLAIWFFVYRQVLYVTEPKATAVPPPVSVLIAARNEGENLMQFLPAVLEQSYPAFEVVVVDDDSSDDTPAVLRQLSEQYQHLRTIRLTPKIHPGKKTALAAAIGAAHFEHLLFTDADCRPASEHWLTGMVRVWGSETAIVLGYAPLEAEDTLLNRWIRFEADFGAMTYLSLTKLGVPYMGVGRNMGWMKGLFAQNNGFGGHATLPGGDDDLFVNARARPGNTAVALSPDAFVYSPAKKTLQAWIRQKRRHLSTARHYRPAHQAILSGISLSRALFHLWCALLMLTPLRWWALAALLCRWIVVGPVYLHIQHRLGQHAQWIYFPVFDLLLSVYDALIVPFALVRKPSDW